MEWTPSEIALVVSTSATALTAVSAIAVPLWMNAIEKRHDRRSRSYAKASEAVHFCVENIEHVINHREKNNMRMALMGSGQAVDWSDPEADQVSRDFDRRFRFAQLLAEELHVDFKSFRS